jgi:hydroxymethylbilane synthase
MRKSALSQWQARYVRDRLLAANPQCEVILHAHEHEGRPHSINRWHRSGQGSLRRGNRIGHAAIGEADLAVHSLKDMPMDMAAGFTLAAVPEREDPRDAS